MSMRRFAAVPPALLILAPLVLALFSIGRYAVNVPALDEWHLAEDLHAIYEGHEGPSDLWRQHNEHRMLFPRVALLTLAWMSGWNTVVEMYVSVGLLICILAVWWRLYRAVRRAGLWTFVPIAWLILSPGQWENVLTGWQLQFCLGVAAMVWAMFLLGRGTMAGFGAAALCAIVASYSFNNGLVAWPAGLIALGLMRAPQGRVVRWAIFGVLATAIYYVGYVPAPNHPSPLEAFAHPFETLSFVLMNLGAPLAGGSLTLAAAVGVFVLALLVASLVRVWPHRGALLPLSGTTASLCGLLSVSLGSSLAIAIGRVGFHQPTWAISSRYVTITALGIAALYLLYLAGSPDSSVETTPADARRLWPEWTDLRSMLLALTLVGEAASVSWSLEAATNLRAARMKEKYAVQTFLVQPDDAFASPVDAAIVRKYGTFLQGQGWSVFRDPVSYVLLASTDKGVPSGEILPDRPVVQQMTCPVSTLTDLQILFATYKRKNTSLVKITLSEADRPLVERLLPGATLQDNGWLRISVLPPVERCAGRELVLTISSPDAKPGNAVTVWTYPRYYKAAIISPREKTYSGRVVGMSMNVGQR
ncbi:MAG: hypothetical protein HYS05_13305 [Acidobacteria bacterium]|nr:hypothetical protein [Acidobacteriota bacterium]